jgi:hypothetical protein
LLLCSLLFLLGGFFFYFLPLLLFLNSFFFFVSLLSTPLPHRFGHNLVLSDHCQQALPSCCGEHCSPTTHRRAVQRRACSSSRFAISLYFLSLPVLSPSLLRCILVYLPCDCFPKNADVIVCDLAPMTILALFVVTKFGYSPFSLNSFISFHFPLAQSSTPHRTKSSTMTCARPGPPSLPSTWILAATQRWLQTWTQPDAWSQCEPAERKQYMYSKLIQAVIISKFRILNDSEHVLVLIIDCSNAYLPIGLRLSGSAWTATSARDCARHWRSGQRLAWISRLPASPRPLSRQTGVFGVLLLLFSSLCMLHYSLSLSLSSSRYL